MVEVVHHLPRRMWARSGARCVQIEARPPSVLGISFSPLLARPTGWRTIPVLLTPFFGPSVPTHPDPYVLSLQGFPAPFLQKTAFYKPDFTLTRALSLILELVLKRKLNSTSFIISVHISAVTHEKTRKTLDAISHSIHKIRKGILSPTAGGNTGVQCIHTFSSSRFLPFADFLLCERISFSKWEKGKRRTSVVGQQLTNCLTQSYNIRVGGNYCQFLNFS